jgi:hypothetical protein
MVEPEIVGLLHKPDEQRCLTTVHDPLHRGDQVQCVPGVAHLLRISKVDLFQSRQIHVIDRRQRLGVFGRVRRRSRDSEDDR